MASQDSHECCKIHGGVVAMDAMTGKRVWEGHTMEQAKPIKDRGDGKMIWGPAGAPVWNSPSIDQETRPDLRRHGRSQLGACAQEHQRHHGIQPEGRLDQVVAPGDAQRRVQRRLQPARRTEELPARGRDGVPRRGLRRIDHHRQGPQRERARPRRPEIRHGLGDEPGHRRGRMAHATSAPAARTAASTGASPPTTRMSTRRSAISADRSPGRTCRPT